MFMRVRVHEASLFDKEKTERRELAQLRISKPVALKKENMLTLICWPFCHLEGSERSVVSRVSMPHAAWAIFFQPAIDDCKVF